MMASSVEGPCGIVDISFNGVRCLSQSLCVVVVLIDVDDGIWGGATGACELWWPLTTDDRGSCL
jgi:hypothetical protein